MRPVSRALVGVLLCCSAAAVAWGKCGDNSADAEAVNAARVQVLTDCDCAGAPTHGAYVQCAAGIAKQRVAAGVLPVECKGDVRRCAARSTCGKPGFVTCCIPGAANPCRIMKDATLCTARGGTAGACTSCCEACGGAGCTPPTSTSTTTTSTTTTTTLACSDTSRPTCGGSCPAGQVCQAIGESGTPGFCQCVPSDVVCDGVGGQCVLGTCPPGEVCKILINGIDCTCLPPGY